MRYVACLLLGLFAYSGGTGGAPRAKVKTGLDVLVSNGFSEFDGKRIGLITNQTGLDRRGVHAVELIRQAKGARLLAIFTPEHGFTGTIEHGQTVQDGSYPGTRIPIHSLYGKSKRPTETALRNLDALVFDMQDAGARFYTYVTTLGYCLEEAANHDIEFYVLDRPNPGGGEIVEGETLADDIRHFTAYYSVPVRHGLTVGEIARWHADKAKLKVRLVVIPMEGWTRSMLWEDTDLRFVPPSPNIRTPKTALLYPGIGGFESTNVAVGRGTTSPFEVFGAPWMNGDEIARGLNTLSLPGAKFKAIRFTPAKDLYEGQSCSGIQVTVTDPRKIRPVDIFIHALCLIRDFHPKHLKPRWNEMPHMVGSKDFERLFNAGTPATELLERFHQSAAKFLETRKPYLLYP